METAEQELTYVGFWLAQTGEIESLKIALRTLLERHIRVTLVLLDRELDEIQRSKVAAVLGLTANSLSDRLENAWAELFCFRDSLPDEIRPRLVLRRHQEHLQASAFLFDRGRESAKTLVDFKFYGAGRQASFGIELRPTKDQSESSLYERATKSFALVDERALPA